jgi:hypothetical protein
MLVCKLACFASNTHAFTVPLDKFCEDIPMRALKQFSTAILAAAQRDRAGAPPQETDPDLVNCMDCSAEEGSSNGDELWLLSHKPWARVDRHKSKWISTNLGTDRHYCSVASRATCCP